MAWPVRTPISGPWTAEPLNDLAEPTAPAVPIDLPHQWADDPRFAPATSSVRYRTDLTPVRAQRRTSRGLPERHWLEVCGAFYTTELEVNDKPHEGYFFPHIYELTESAQEKTVSVSLDVRSDQPANVRTKRQLTGVFQHCDAIDPTFNPGGLWRNVNYVRTGPVAIHRLRLLCVEANESVATVQLRAELNSDIPRTVTVRTTVSPRNKNVEPLILEEEHQLAAGNNRVKWSAIIRDPQLWWPTGYGEQARYDVVTEIVASNDEGESVVSDTRTQTTGLRTIHVSDFVFFVNGTRIYLKGANYLPTSYLLSNVSETDTRNDVKRALGLGLNMLHVYGHVGDPSLYEAADELGLLLWQDMPMIWGYSVAVRAEATRQARELVNFYGHHPSIIAWFGHNEPVALDEDDSRDRTGAGTRAKYLARQQLPTFSRTVLGALVRRAIHDADASRPTYASSGVIPHVGARGSDTHSRVGWDHGELIDFNDALSRVPTTSRFVGAFGAQSIPVTDDFLPVSRWPEWDFDDIETLFGANVAALNAHTPFENSASYGDWKFQTQQYQAKLLRHHIERLRVLKYRPNGGFAFSYLSDAQPAISFALYDYERKAKPAVDVVRRSCAPVIVVADWPDADYELDSTVELGVYVVNDHYEALGDASVTAAVTTPDDDLVWTWEGDIGADTVSRVGVVSFAAKTPGPLVFALTLSYGEHTVTNSYTSTIGDETP